MRMHAHLCICVGICVHVCIYVYVHMCMSVCECVTVGIRVCIHMRTTNVPGWVHQRLWYVLSYFRKVHIIDPSLFIGKSNICGVGGLPLRKYVTMTI